MFREALKEDLPEIARIHSDAWHAAYSSLVDAKVMAGITPETRLDVWREWFEVGNHNLILLIEEGQVLGFIRLCPARPVANPPPNHGELSHLYLDPHIIAQGYGHQLFELAKLTLESQGYTGMLLWTLEGNSRARRFYENHGMYADGAREEEPDWLGEGVFEVRYVIPFNNENNPVDA